MQIGTANDFPQLTIALGRPDVSRDSAADISIVMKPLVYILCPSYSGSTLLTLLLATHRDIATIGELKATALGDIDKYQCSCGRLILSCPFWNELGARMKAKGHNFSPRSFGTHFRATSSFADAILRAGLRGRPFEILRHLAIHSIPATHRHFQAIVSRNLAMVESICELTGGRVFLDGSKDPIRLEYLRTAGFSAVQVIYLLRDGRGTTFSSIRRHKVSMEHAAHEWVRDQHECDRATERLAAQQMIRIRYEDLCREPAATMESIYQFLGLDPKEGSLTYLATDHHILGNSMRLRPIQTIRLDEGWREGLNADDLATFRRLAGKLNRSYGYEDS